MDIFDAVYFSEVVVVFVMVFDLALLGKNGSGQRSSNPFHDAWFSFVSENAVQILLVVHIVCLWLQSQSPAR